RVPPQHPMNSGAGDTTQLVPGYPIRTPWDHSSVGSSPRPIAASHVLHRPLVPRHPHVRPSPLDHNTKMLASTMQLSTNHQQKTGTHPTCVPVSSQPDRVPPTHTRTQARASSRGMMTKKPGNPTTGSLERR